jgi:hypothetical protein
MHIGEGGVEGGDPSVPIADEAVHRAGRKEAVGAGDGAGVDVSAGGLATVGEAEDGDAPAAGPVELGAVTSPVPDKHVDRPRRQLSVVAGSGVDGGIGGLPAIVDGHGERGKSGAGDGAERDVPAPAVDERPGAAGRCPAPLIRLEADVRAEAAGQLDRLHRFGRSRAAIAGVAPATARIPTTAAAAAVARIPRGRRPPATSKAPRGLYLASNEKICATTSQLAARSVQTNRGQ